MSKLKSNIEKDFKKKEPLHLSKFQKVKIDKNFQKSHKNFKLLKDMDDTEFGFYWVDQPYVVGYVTCNDYGWITALELSDHYKGHGLGEQLLDYAIKNLGGNRLGVHKDNQVAYKLYKKHGFYECNAKDVGGSGKDMIFMTNDPSIYNKKEKAMTKYEAVLEYVSCLYDFGFISKEKALKLNNEAFQKYRTIGMTITEASVFKPAIDKIRKVGKKFVNKSDSQNFVNRKARERMEKEVAAAEEALAQAKERKDRKAIRDAEKTLKNKTAILNKMGGPITFLSNIIPNNNPDVAKTQNLPNYSTAINAQKKNVDAAEKQLKAAQSTGDKTTIAKAEGNVQKTKDALNKLFSRQKSSDDKREKKELKVGYRHLDLGNDQAKANQADLQKLAERENRDKNKVYNTPDEVALDDGTIVRVHISGDTGKPYYTFKDKQGNGVDRDASYIKQNVVDNKDVKNAVASLIHKKGNEIKANNKNMEVINSRKFERETIDDNIAHSDAKLFKTVKATKKFKKDKKNAIKDLEHKNEVRENILSKDTAKDVERQDRLRDKKYEILRDRARQGKAIPKKFLESVSELQDLIFEAFDNYYITDKERMYLLESVDDIMKENDQ